MKQKNIKTKRFKFSRQLLKRRDDGYNDDDDERDGRWCRRRREWRRRCLLTMQAQTKARKTGNDGTCVINTRRALSSVYFVQLTMTLSKTKRVTKWTLPLAKTVVGGKGWEKVGKCSDIRRVLHPDSYQMKHGLMFLILYCSSQPSWAIILIGIPQKPQFCWLFCFSLLGLKRTEGCL